LIEGVQFIAVLTRVVVVDAKHLGHRPSALAALDVDEHVQCVAYAHLAPEELKQAADDLGERLIGQAKPSESLVTFWSHSPIPELPAESGDDQSSANLQSGFDIDRMGVGGGMSQTVNPDKDRRDEATDDGLRRADDDWG
jgi:hypothetical protein